MIRYGFILAFICVVASASLALVNSATKSKIMAQAQAEEDAGLKELLPQAAHFEPVKTADTVAYYKAHDSNGNLIGVVFIASGKGYASQVQSLAAMKTDGTIIAVKIISQNETPGVGTRVAEPSFTGQFTNKSNLDNVQAITGATISSRAVIESVKLKAEEVKRLIKNE